MSKTFTLLIALFFSIALSGQVDLPITFEDDNLDYELFDFGGAVTTVVTDPTDASNTVAQTVKTAGSVATAGTVVAVANGLVNPIPFTEEATILSVRIWSPTAGTAVRLKVENAADNTIFVETEMFTTMAGGFETIDFDFADPAIGAINDAITYSKIVIFFDFGNAPTVASTYYWDDITFTGTTGGGGGNENQIDLPITFENDDTDYELFDFEGAATTIVTDPTNADNTVAQTIKNAGAATFAGTVIAVVNGLANPIPFTEEGTILSVRVWSPAAGTAVRLKVENGADNNIFAETETFTTVAQQFETLTFDFADPVIGALNMATTYSKLVIFFDFGNVPTEPSTYYWDDIIFTGETGGGTVIENQVDLPITFENDSTDYQLLDFEGAESMIVTDPTDADNTVVQTTKNAGAATFAGTVIGVINGLANPIPFTQDATALTVRVWSPTVGTPVRLKVENGADSDIFVETETFTTVAQEFETLTFDFANPAVGALDVAIDYSKLVIFFDFGSVPTEPSTYYWDDIMMPDSTSSVSIPVVGVLEAFPNPVGDRLTIAAPVTMDQVTLYSVTGSIIGTWAVNAERYDLDMVGLTPGFYVAIATSGQRSYSVKVLKR